VRPAGSTIMFAYSHLEYRPGIELAHGHSALVITRSGDKPERRGVTKYDADRSLDVVLEPEK